MADYTAKRIDDMEAGFGGGFVKVRAELGVTSFGMQVIRMPPNYDDYPEHDHAEDGQEEVYLALDGLGLDRHRRRARRPRRATCSYAWRRARSARCIPGPEGLTMLVDRRRAPARRTRSHRRPSSRAPRASAPDRAAPADDTQPARSSACEAAVSREREAPPRSGARRRATSSSCTSSTGECM